MKLIRQVAKHLSRNFQLGSFPAVAVSFSTHILQLPGLKLHCEKHLGESINPLNVADILLLSENYKCDSLKKTALAYCGLNHSYIMKVTYSFIPQSPTPLPEPENELKNC